MNLAALLPLLLLLLAGCDEVILNELDEIRANKVKVVLADNGIEGRKIRVGARWNIAVPADRAAAALRIVDSSRLLTRELSRARPDGGNLFRSRDEREQQQQRATAEELSQTIEGLPGVLEAHVHLYRPPPEAFDQPGGRPSAGVVILAAQDFQLPPAAVVQIISGAAGIEPEKINVNKILLPANAAAPEPHSPAGTGSAELPAVRPLWFAAAGLLLLSLILLRRRKIQPPGAAAGAAGGPGAKFKPPLRPRAPLVPQSEPADALSSVSAR